MTLSITNPYSIRLGVVGAGTMGSGIALAALLANMVVTLYDPSSEMLERAREYVEKHLSKKGRGIDYQNLTLTNELEKLRGAGVVIEAAPEDLGLKQDLFTRLDALCPPPAILATNTSTLPVTAIAAAVGKPERVAGMHFFNPAPVLPLVEVVRGARTTPETVAALVELAGVIGKTPVVARDTPGFIVNRVARPFYGEALRLLGEGAATHEEIDRLVRLGGRFPMGPFQLMDLIGIDINFAATQSMWEQSFGEPRYRPHPIQAQMVQQGALGRKTGRGFYSYDTEQPVEERKLPPKGRQKGSVLLSRGARAPGAAELLRGAGYRLSNTMMVDAVAGLVIAGKDEELEKQIVQVDRALPDQLPLFCQCADVTLNEIAGWIRHPDRLVGFDGLFLANGPIATLVPGPTLMPQVRSGADTFFAGLGYLSVWVQDTPALILPRIVTMLANEAAFALGEAVADLSTIDRAMRLGTNYPKGPLAWAKELGYSCVVAILDHLLAEYGEERYRAAPLLRRWARLELVLH